MGRRKKKAQQNSNDEAASPPTQPVMDEEEERFQRELELAMKLSKEEEAKRLQMESSQKSAEDAVTKWNNSYQSDKYSNEHPDDKFASVNNKRDARKKNELGMDGPSSSSLSGTNSSKLGSSSQSPITSGTNFAVSSSSVTAMASLDSDLDDTKLSRKLKKDKLEAIEAEIELNQQRRELTLIDFIAPSSKIKNNTGSAAVSAQSTQSSNKLANNAATASTWQTPTKAVMVVPLQAVVTQQSSSPSSVNVKQSTTNLPASRPPIAPSPASVAVTGKFGAYSTPTGSPVKQPSVAVTNSSITSNNNNNNNNKPIFGSAWGQSSSTTSVPTIPTSPITAHATSSTLLVQPQPQPLPHKLADTLLHSNTQAPTPSSLDRTKRAITPPTQIPQHYQMHLSQSLLHQQKQQQQQQHLPPQTVTKSTPSRTPSATNSTHYSLFNTGFAFTGEPSSSLSVSPPPTSSIFTGTEVSNNGHGHGHHHNSNNNINNNINNNNSNFKVQHSRMNSYMNINIHSKSNGGSTNGDEGDDEDDGSDKQKYLQHMQQQFLFGFHNGKSHTNHKTIPPQPSSSGFYTPTTNSTTNPNSNVPSHTTTTASIQRSHPTTQYSATTTHPQSYLPNDPQLPATKEEHSEDEQVAVLMRYLLNSQN